MDNLGILKIQVSCRIRNECYNLRGVPEVHKKKYSGKFNLRVGKDIHEQIAVTALKKGQSLNKFCVDTLKKEIGL